MKKLLVVAMLGAPLGAQYIDVLVYADDYFVPNPEALSVIKALRYIDLNEFDLTWSLYYQDPNGFGNAIRDKQWSLIIVDHAASNAYGIGQWWDSLAAWVNGGGRLIVSTYDVDGSSTGSTILWNLMGVSAVTGDIGDLDTLTIWDNSVFDGPEIPPNRIGFDNVYQDEGDSVSALLDFQELAGWNFTYFGNNAASLLSPECRKALNTFIVQESHGDADTDGIIDGVEFYIDEIWYLLECSNYGADEQIPTRPEAFRFSPNPVQDILWIEAPAGSVVSLWDGSGRRLLSEITAGTTSFNTRELPPGAYILLVQTAEGSAHSAVVIRE